MNIGDIGRLVRRNAKHHSPLILSGVAGLGTLVTAYLVGKASFEAAEIIRLDEDATGTHADPKERLIERTKLVWKLYIPSAVSAASTITCIVCANRFATNKTIAAQTALTVSQQVYSDYRDKVIEEFGARKDQSIRDKVAADRVKENPPPSQEVLVTGPGNVLCMEMYTGRYFTSDADKLHKAENLLNKRVLTHDYATFDDFYYMIGINPTASSSNVGWKSDRLMELQFTAVLTEDERPCLAFDYNYYVPL